jgi:hypothetical protein
MLSKLINRKIQNNLYGSKRVLIFRLFSDQSNQNASSSGNNNKKDEAEIKIDLDAINKKIEADLANAKEGKPTELDKTFMNFEARRTVSI